VKIVSGNYDFGEEENMIKVPLVGKFKGQYALVDDQDAWVLKLEWEGVKYPSGIVYARVSSWKEGLHGQLMHRLILGLGPEDSEVNCIEDDSLNC